MSSRTPEGLGRRAEPRLFQPLPQPLPNLVLGHSCTSSELLLGLLDLVQQMETLDQNIPIDLCILRQLRNHLKDL